MKKVNGSSSSQQQRQLNSSYLSFSLVTFLAILIFVDDGCASQEDYNNYYMKREHSLAKPYQGSGWLIPNWDFIGSTIVTNEYIRVTPDTRSQRGAIWNSVPVTMRNWRVELTISINGKGKKDLFGDGMSFYYARDRMMLGSVFGSIDLFSGLAIIVDTYSNHNGPHNHAHPYLSAMVNNGSLSYDHDKDGTLTQLAGCEIKTLRNLPKATILIEYENDVLTVSSDVNSGGSDGSDKPFDKCFSVPGILLPTGYYFGVSAATGDLSDNHDLIAFRTFELGSDPRQRPEQIPTATNFEAPRERIEDEKPAKWSGLKIFLYTLIAILALVAIGVVGVIVYQNHQSNSRKRFY